MVVPVSQKPTDKEVSSDLEICSPLYLQQAVLESLEVSRLAKAPAQSFPKHSSSEGLCSWRLPSPSARSNECSTENLALFIY